MRWLFATILGLVPSAAWACPGCQPAVLASVLDGDFARTLLTLMAPLGVLGGVAAGLHFSDGLGANRGR